MVHVVVEWPLIKCQNDEEECANFCGLLRKAELYISILICLRLITCFGRTTKSFSEVKKSFSHQPPKPLFYYVLLMAESLFGPALLFSTLEHGLLKKSMTRWAEVWANSQIKLLKT